MQHIDYTHWYDRQKQILKDVQNVQYVASMNPTAGSFTINSRLQRHFSVFAISFPQVTTHTVFIHCNTEEILLIRHHWKIV